MTNNKKRFWKILFNIVGYTLCVLMVMLAVFIFYVSYNYDYYPVSGESMYPTLNGNNINEDYVYIGRKDNFTYQDIVVYKNPENILVIKRVIAMSGDKVCVKYNTNGELAIFIIKAGQSTPEELIENYIQNKSSMNTLYSTLYNHINSNKTFVDIDGFKYLVVEEGKMFCLGDNRANSKDCAEYGPISIENYLGKVHFVVYKGRWKILQVLKQFLGGN